MLYHLLYPLKDYFSGFNVFRYISFRCIFAATTAFLIGVLLGPRLFRHLRTNGVTENIDKTDSPQIAKLNSSKKKTPTMGGLVIIASLIVATLLWARLNSLYVILGLLAVACLGFLGFVDDYIKLKDRVKHGLSRKQKLATQLGLGLALGASLYFAGSNSVRYYTPELTRLEAKQSAEAQTDKGLAGSSTPKLAVPFLSRWYLPLPFVLFMLLAALVITGTSNAVNLTDGMDGLAIGCSITTTIALIAVSYIAGRVDFCRYLFIPYVPGAGELSVFCCALLCAELAFLWFNCYPAEVFMGDTGALSLGGALGFVAVAVRQELVLFIAGGVFVAEAASVLLQTFYFRRTGGKRLFRCAPLHHHFQFKGWPETKVTARLCIIAAILAGLGLATLKLR
jgi:phospho-N-acetylmuramoyl-pentapeptide-transferase